MDEYASFDRHGPLAHWLEDFKYPAPPKDKPATAAFRIGQRLKVKHGPHQFWFRVTELGKDGKPTRLELCEPPTA